VGRVGWEKGGIKRCRTSETPPSTACDELSRVGGDPGGGCSELLKQWDLYFCIRKMTSKLIKYAKTMMKNPTVAKNKLWSRLRSKIMKGLKFRRQQPIDDIIVDFVNFDKRIVIEVDGRQHANEKYNE
jgi:hypothetical protein